MSVHLIIDDREIEAEEGAALLETCLENGIYVPNLCHVPGSQRPSASCRLCFVEVESLAGPQPSCTLAVRDGMRVRTDTPLVRRLQKAAFELLLSTHEVDCGRCPANKKCELQRMARFLKVGLKPGRLEKHLKKSLPEAAHPVLSFYPNRCVLCGRCIRVCTDLHGRPYLTLAGRGYDTILTSYGLENSGELPCGECGACVDVCPVAAILPTRQA